MVKFKSVVTAIDAASTLNQPQCRKSCIVLLENFTNYEHKLPPQVLAASGNLEELCASVKAFGLTLKERDRDHSTLLHHATSTNQVAVMQYLIENGISMNATDKDGNTALHVAVLKGHVNAVHLLLNSGASTVILNSAKDAPLHIAAREKSCQVLKAYLSYPVDLLIKGYRNRNVVHTLAEMDNVDGCKLIHEYVMKRESEYVDEEKGFRLCSKDDDDLTPIHLAARKNSYQTLEFFILKSQEHGYSLDKIFEFIDEENSTPLHAAVDGGNYEVVRLLLKYGASPLVIKEDMSPPLHLACSQGRLEIVKAMVEAAGKDILHQPDQYSRTPLHYAAFSVFGTGVILYIIEEDDGIDINQRDEKGRTPLHMSISSGNLAGVKELLARGADPFKKDNEGFNALHFAVVHNKKAIIHTLLTNPDSDELVTEVNNRGYSPMHIGLKLGLGDITSTLISSIIIHPKTVKDPNGDNYMHLAAASGNWKALSAFLDLPNAHKLLNELNSCGSTALHNAAKNGHSHCVELLLNSGAMVHRCYQGISPLMLACREGHIQCTKLLFKAYPFQIDWQDDNGDTALHYAAQSGSPAMIQQALDLGGKIMHNDKGESFLNIIICRGDEDCGLAVVNHKRWQQCLDVKSPVHEDTMLGLIRRMPTIAKAVLDRCYKEEHSSDKLHPNFSQTFNFKYLLCPDDKQVPESESTLDLESGKSSTRKLLRRRSTRRTSYDGFAITNLDSAGNDFNVVVHRNRRNQPPVGAAVSKKKKHSETMEVLQRMIQHRRIKLLIHPVVSAYLKQKWKSYGRFCYSLYFGILLLLVVSLTLFVIVGPNPSKHNESLRRQDDNSSDNETSPFLKMTTAQYATRGLASIFNLLYTVFAILIFISQGWRSIYFFNRIQSWISGLAIVFNYIFLFSPDPFRMGMLPFGSCACFFTWLALFEALEMFDKLGIYVNMFFKILRTAFQVLFLCSFLIIAFGISMYIIASEITDFSNVGYASFTVFGYMFGEIPYSLYVEKTSSMSTGSLERSLSAITIVFIVVLAVMMSIVMMNLLIGLAVGDIEQIKMNAMYQRRMLEIDFFSRIDNNLPKCLRHKAIFESYKNYPNLKKKCRVRKCLKSFVEEVLDADETENADSNNNTIHAPVDVATEVSSMKQKLEELSDLLHDLQGDHCQRKRQRFRWQQPQSSLHASDSEISLTASDFLP